MEEINRLEAIAVPVAARVGDLVASIDTPGLILDLDAFEENLRKMQALAERHGVALRPHAKAHKCPDIALRQIALGAQGICCEKVSEAIPFLAAGVRDIHIGTEVVGAGKLALLARMAGKARFTVCADHPRAVEALSAAMAEHRASIGVFIEVDIGQKRCGVQSHDEAVALARLILRLPNLEFSGIQARHGGLKLAASLRRREKSSLKAARLIRRYLRALEQADIECPRVTGGATESAVFDVANGAYTEIQAGAYAFMDADYARIDWGEALSFRHSLFLLATVTSVPEADRAVLDAGVKSMGAASSPAFAENPGWRCVAVTGEHSVLRARNPRALPPLGAQIRLVPGQCGLTFNLHDAVIAVRGQHVEAIWPISARGLSR